MGNTRGLCYLILLISVAGPVFANDDNPSEGSQPHPVPTLLGDEDPGEGDGEGKILPLPVVTNLEPDEGEEDEEEGGNDDGPEVNPLPPTLPLVPADPIAQTPEREDTNPNNEGDKDCPVDSPPAADGAPTNTGDSEASNPSEAADPLVPTGVEVVPNNEDGDEPINLPSASAGTPVRSDCGNKHDEDGGGEDGKETGSEAGRDTPVVTAIDNEENEEEEGGEPVPLPGELPDGEASNPNGGSDTPEALPVDQAPPEAQAGVNDQDDGQNDADNPDDEEAEAGTIASNSTMDPADNSTNSTVDMDSTVTDSTIDTDQTTNSANDTTDSPSKDSDSPNMDDWVHVTLKCKGEYSHVLGRENEAVMSFTTQLAQTVNITDDSIKNMVLSPGSIQIDFDIAPSEGNTPDGASPSDIANDLKQKVDSEGLGLEFDEETFDAIPGSFISYAFGDPCSDITCQNNGQCVKDGDTGFKCRCKFGYKGSVCQDDYFILIVSCLAVAGFIFIIVLILACYICCRGEPSESSLIYRDLQEDNGSIGKEYLKDEKEKKPEPKKKQTGQKERPKPTYRELEDDEITIGSGKKWKPSYLK